MTRMTGLTLAIALLTSGAAWANPPTSSPRPQSRSIPDTEVTQAVVANTAETGLVAQVLRDVKQPAAPGKVVQATLAGGVIHSPRPPERPENLYRKATVAAAGFRAVPLPPVSGIKGTLCGDPSIQGVRMSPIAGRLRGCGVPEPVQVRAVSGVTLSTPATMDCTTAKALKSWVDRGVMPVIGRLGGGPAELRVAAHYSCRTRNNQPGAKISNHGMGQAIDISGIVLQNGVAIDVLKGWRGGQHSGMLKAMHRAACGPFGTVLGPNADRYHQDHFHLDTARYRRGSYCH